MSAQPPAEPTANVSSPSASRLRGIVQSRMWKWLFDAHHLLGAAVEVVDLQVGLLTSRPSEIAGLRQEFGRPTDESLHRAIVQSLTSGTPSVTMSGSLRVSCT